MEAKEFNSLMSQIRGDVIDKPSHRGKLIKIAAEAILDAVYENHSVSFLLDGYLVKELKFSDKKFFMGSTEVKIDDVWTFCLRYWQFACIA